MPVLRYKKKLKPDISSDFGDIDLLGFEGKGLTLAEKYKNIAKEVHGVKTLMAKIEHIETNNLSKVSFDLKPQIVDVLKNSLIVLTLFSEEIRKVEEKKEYARQKFISRSGPDCRHG